MICSLVLLAAAHGIPHWLVRRFRQATTLRLWRRRRRRRRRGSGDASGVRNSANREGCDLFVCFQKRGGKEEEWNPSIFRFFFRLRRWRERFPEPPMQVDKATPPSFCFNFQSPPPPLSSMAAHATFPQNTKT